MKHGLVRSVDTDESVAEFAHRLEEFRHTLRGRDVQVGLLYGDVETAQPLTFLTNVCVYWGHAVLVVPVDADPVLVTSSSKRVHPWILRSSVIEEIHTTPDLGRTAGEHVAAAGYEEAGIVDQRYWPNAAVRDLCLAADGVTLKDLGPLSRRLQVVPSAGQRVALTRVARLCHEGLAAFRDGDGDTASRVGAAEYAMRMGGATDVYISASPASPGHPASAQCVELKCHVASEWSGLQRFTFAAGRDGESVQASIERSFAAWLEQLTPGTSVTEAEEGAETALERECPGADRVRARLLAHADIETDGAFGGSLEPGALQEGAILSASIDVRTPEDQLVRIGDTVSIDPGGARVLAATSG